MALALYDICHDDSHGPDEYRATVQTKKVPIRFMFFQNMLNLQSNIFILNILSLNILPPLSVHREV